MTDFVRVATAGISGLTQAADQVLAAAAGLSVLWSGETAPEPGVAQGKRVWKNRYLKINNMDLSHYIRNAELKFDAQAVEAACDGDLTEIALGGLLGWSLEIEMAQDFDAAGLDAFFFPLVGSRVAINLRAENVPLSADNPEYRGLALLADYPALMGKTGDLAVIKIGLKAAGGLQRFS